MKIFSVLFLLCTLALFADDEFGYSSAATCQLNETAHFLPDLPKVNVVTGEYCENEIDLVVAGAEPISLRRFYQHLGFKDPLYGHWRINPEHQVLFNFRAKNFDRFVGKGMENGGFFLCEQRGDQSFSFDAEKNRGFTNCGGSCLSGQTHPLNTYASCYVRKPTKNERSWDGCFVEGNGKKSYYETERKNWPNKLKEEDPMPPYQAKMLREELPNGNVIHYAYKRFRGAKTHRFGYPDYELLTGISAYSAAGVYLGGLRIEYCFKVRDKKKTKQKLMEQIAITGSDQRYVYHFHTQKKARRRVHNLIRTQVFPVYDVQLTGVQCVGQPEQSYDYQERYSFWEPLSGRKTRRAMTARKQPNGRDFYTTYDDNDESQKVIMQSAPVGPNGEICPIARFSYESDHTIVTDAEDNKKIYRFDSDKRIIAIERYEGDALYSIEKSRYESATGNLLEKRLEDAYGKLYYRATYKYDKNHNVIEERKGDETGEDVVYRTFSEDGFNLKLTESDRPGKLICYSYVPGTNKIAKELVYDHGEIKRRTFYHYDEKLCSVCVRKVVDDGKGEICFITEMRPKRELPCIGLCEERIEKAVDKGVERQLSRVRYSYHPSGKIEREEHYDADDNFCYALTKEYDEKERCIASTDALGVRTTYSYDDNFNCTSIRTPTSYEEISYDRANRPVERRYGDGLRKRSFYDKLCRVRYEIDVTGGTTSYRYDALGRVIAVTYPEGTTETKQYDPLGNVVEEVDGEGYVTKREVNFRGQPTAIMYPDGSSEYFTYSNEGGVLLSHQDRNGATTYYTYDSFDRALTKETYSSTGALLQRTEATYNAFHKLTESDAKGQLTTYRYDFAGRKIAEQKGERLITFGYDALGRANFMQKGDELHYESFDYKGQLVEKRITDSEGQIQFLESYGYNSQGKRTELFSCGAVWRTKYNGRGELIEECDPEGNVTTIQYTYEGGLTKKRREPTGVTTLQIFDLRRRCKEERVLNDKEEVMQRQEYEYDRVGNRVAAREHIYHGSNYKGDVTHTWEYGPNRQLLTFVEAGEKRTSYAYDSAGRLVTTTKPDGTILYREYDELGRLSRHYGADFDYYYTYDANNNIIALRDAFTGTTTTREYNVYDSITAETLATGITLTYTSDPYGRRESLTLPDGSKALYTYRGKDLYSIEYQGYRHTYSARNEVGLLTKVTRIDKSRLALTWDSSLRCTKITSPSYSALYSYDCGGNLTAFEATDTLGPTSCYYEYDELMQLTSDNGQKYLYDSLYNRLDEGHTINRCNQIEKEGFVYDLRGNLLSDGEREYEYDSLDRLLSVRRGEKTTRYRYDGFNRRIAKDKSSFIWEGNLEIGRMEGGSIKELRILGEGLGAEMGSAILLRLGSTTYLPTHDHRGSLVALKKMKGGSGEAYRYTAFGEELTTTGLSPWRFASKRFDEESGLLYFGRRYYAPTLGRWLTADPMGYGDGPNLYAYVHNSPHTTLDLHGLMGFSLGFGWGNQTYYPQGLNIPQQQIQFRYYEQALTSIGCNTTGQKSDLFDFSNADYPDLPTGSIYYTNGMNCLAYDCVQNALYLSELGGGINIHGCYNTTHGFLDVVECGLGLYGGIATTPSFVIQRGWDDFFDNAKSNAVLLQFCHSQGAINVRNALMCYSEERRKRIRVVAIAPAAYISEDLCHSVHHYVSQYDFVPLFDHRGRKANQANITILEPHPDAKRFDHGFQSPTYRQSIIYEIKDYIKKYGNI